MNAELSLINAAKNLRLARQRLEKAMDTAKQAANAAHPEVSEVDLARILDVNRHTVRRWLGK